MAYTILNTMGKDFRGRAQEILNRLGPVEYRQVTEDELARSIGAYDAVLVGLSPRIDRAVLEKAKRLQAIAIPSNTLSSIDTSAAAEKGIAVLSLKGETAFLNTITSTAELSFGLLIDLMRRTPWSFNAVKRYEWDRERFCGHTLYGATLGIVGMGRLGTWMARYGTAFGMSVIFYDPHVSKAPVSGCRKVSFEELCAESDAISIHVHAVAETTQMFDNTAFARMKPSVRIVNTAQSGIVDEDALLSALETGAVGGYAADILAPDPTLDTRAFTIHPLVEYAKTHDTVIIVPRTGGMTEESRERTDVFIAEKLANYFSQQSV